jgi:hypothetical protein
MTLVAIGGDGFGGSVTIALQRGRRVVLSAEQR